MAVQVQAYTSVNSNGTLGGLTWLDISQVIYTTTNYIFTTVYCGLCVQTSLRLVTASSTEAHVEMAHYITDSQCPSGCLRYVGDFVPDNLVRGLPQQSATVIMGVSPTGSGTILTNGQNISSVTVNIGTQVTWQAVASSGWAFNYFISTNGVTTTQNPFTATVNSSGSITAVFVSTTQPPTTQPPTTQPPTTQPPTTQPPTTQPPPGGTTPPPPVWTCDPVKCPNNGQNYCLSGTCVPKKYVVYGALGFFALMMLR